MRARRTPCTEAHARQEGSGAAAAHRQRSVKPRRDRSATIAAAIAGAFLAGEWDPPGMGRRAKRALGGRRKWPTALAHVVHAAFPERPVDRPRELADLIVATSLFSSALADRQRPLR